MGGIREYLLSVIAVCMICVIARQFVKKESFQKITAFVGGLLILLVVARPLLDLDFKGLSGALEQAAQELEVDVGIIENSANSALEEHIKKTTEAYIEEKARALGGTVQAQVCLTREEYPVPKSVRLTGTMNMSQQAELSTYLSRDLGIPIEEQEWNLYG